MTVEFLFVYGTLRREMATSMHHALARHCDYISDGYMRGRLYEVDGYPGAVESLDQDDKVHGELYRIVDRETLLPLLDAYEECSESYPEPHEYTRKTVAISLAGGGSIPAWVYLFNRDSSNLMPIESGDYSKFPGRRKL